MLRKIEYKLNYLVEAREYILVGNKKKELDEMEKDLHNARKDDNIIKKKAREYIMLEER